MPRTRRSTSLLACTLAASVLGLAGCAGSDSSRSDQAPASTNGGNASAQLDLDAYSRLGYRLKWTGYASMSPGDTLNRFDVLGDLLIVQDTGNNFTAIAPVSGEIRWVAPLAGPLTKFVGVVRDGKRVIACSESEAYYLEADSGTLATKQRFERVVSTKPVLLNSMLIFGTSVGDVLAHLNNGFKAWAYAIGGSIDANPVAVGSEYVGLVSQNGQVIILSAGGSAATRASVYAGLACDPAASDHTLFVASLDQSIYAFDVFANRPKWRKRTDSSLRSSPTYHAGRLYCEVPSAGLVCFDAENGKELWTAKGVSGVVIGSNKGRVICWDGKTASLIDAANGDVIERVAIPGVVKLTVDAFEDGQLYVATPAGAVHKFEPR